MLKSSFSLEGVRRGNGPAGARSSNTLRHLCQLSLNTARLNSLWLSDIEPDYKPVQAVFFDI